MSSEGLSSTVREGDIIAGKYRVERVLGAGGMGVVVAAHHLQLDERVALKFLLPDALKNAEIVARFAREARAAVKIKSEHVARVIDVGQLENGSPYMVMEYLDGGDLGAWLEQRGPLPVEQAVEFVLQACVALADAHALGIVHRDLKPANLFCVRRSDGQLSIKVLDFGISKMVDPVGQSGAMTRTSAVLGTPLYMSPEQIRSTRDVTAQSDIWSLGVILFELMSGKPAFQSETMMELAVKVTNDPTPSIRSFRPEVPPALEAVIARCLEKAPANRYPNVADLAIALLPFAPLRARTSVDRISGILEAAGLSVSGVDFPPSPPGAAAGVAAATIPAVGRTTAGSGGRKTVLVGGVVAATVGLLALGTAVTIFRGAGVHGGVTGDSFAPALGQSAPLPPAPAPATDPAPTAETRTAAPVASDGLPVGAPPRPPPTAGSRPVGSAKKPPVAPAPTVPKGPAATPCKLTKTLDRNGEPHFSCPCASCD